jgi:hypothetical protein
VVKAFSRTVLALSLCSLSLALATCSGETPERPDRGEISAAHPRTMATGGDLTAPRADRRKPDIEAAELQTGHEGDEILVVVEVAQPGYFPYCLLMDFRGRETALKNGIYDGRAESHWPEERSTETVQMGSTYVIVYHEDPDPSREVADPRTTPYFVVCAQTGTRNMDEAHVEGTPET